jgi:hypothetical protein
VSIGGSQTDVGLRSLTAANTAPSFNNIFQNATRVIAYVVYET